MGIITSVYFAKVNHCQYIMPDTIKSLKKENDSLKAQLSALKKDFAKFEEMLRRNEESSEANSSHSRPPLNLETAHAKAWIFLVINTMI